MPNLVSLRRAARGRGLVVVAEERAADTHHTAAWQRVSPGECRGRSWSHSEGSCCLREPHTHTAQHSRGGGRVSECVHMSGGRTFSGDELAHNGRGAAALLLERDLGHYHVVLQHRAAVRAHGVAARRVVFDVRAATLRAHSARHRPQRELHNFQ